MKSFAALFSAASLFTVVCGIPVDAHSAAVHLVETPSTCGSDATARTVNSHGHYWVAANSGSDSGFAGLLVNLNNAPVRLMTFDTSSCTNVVFGITAKQSGGNTVSLTSTVPNSCVDGNQYTVQQLRNGYFRYTIIVSPSNDFVSISQVFAGFKRGNSGLVGNFVYGGNAAIPNTHFTQGNSYCAPPPPPPPP